MNAIKSLALAALAAASLAATTDAQADRGGSAGWHAGRTIHGGGPRWSGGRYWNYGPRVGFYLGAPILFGSWYWGYPYDYYYPRATVIYRDEVEPYPMSYPSGEMGPAPTPEARPRAEGAPPPQAPSYMNYCESAKAYFPKVTTCPEGWKFLPSR